MTRPGAILLIDGRSGSGKSELATAIAAATGSQVVRLDDLYPGWDVPWFDRTYWPNAE